MPHAKTAAAKVSKPSKKTPAKKSSPPAAKKEARHPRQPAAKKPEPVVAKAAAKQTNGANGHSSKAAQRNAKPIEAGAPPRVISIDSPEMQEKLRELVKLAKEQG